MYKTTLALASIGAFNWGLVALFNFNLVSFLFGVDTILTNAVYLIVAASAIIAVSIGFMPEQSSSPKRADGQRPAYSNQ
jgi:hypothetical protein